VHPFWTAYTGVNGCVYTHHEPEPEVEMIPVGGIHLSISATDPAVGFGYGVWARIGGGRVLIGVQEADADFEEAELTGGAKAVTPAGSVSQPTFTGAAMTGVMNHTHTVSVTDPGHNHTQNSHNHTQDAHTHVQNAHTHVQDSHNHTQNSFAPRIINSGTAGTVGVQGASSASNANASNAATTATNQATTAVNQNATAVNQNATATNQAATATNNSNTTGITATTANPAGGVASITPSGTVSQPTFTGQSHTNLPPYLTVYMWVRTE
jgi:hypothetical protein